MNIEHEKTKKIIAAFQKISDIPRCSKNETKIAQFMLEWAAQNRFAAKKDKVGNVVISVPPSPGYENATGVVIQGHLDMVCEKTPDSTHNFSTDPIELVFEGEWLHANKTTLGADNGIAMAMGMVLALEKESPHPPLELLFTVDEEQGLVGANALESGFIQGRILLNIDSEDEGVFTVGCAGGRDTHIVFPIRHRQVDDSYGAYSLKASGLTGGHSGVNINDQRANAIIVLVRALHQLKKQFSVVLASIRGGTAHNAIPRDAEAVMLIPGKEAAAAASEWIKQFEKTCQSEFKNTDPELKLSLEPSGSANDHRAFAKGSSDQLIDMLLALPHGVAAMSTEMKGLVETSNNLASVRTEEKAITIVTSQRSSVMSRLHAITHKVETIALLAKAKPSSSKGYPAWQPNLQSPLLARFKKIYVEMFGKEPMVESIHAGLECGIIGDKYPGMDMISIGPTIKNPHSPAENIHIGSIEKVWDLIQAVLKSLK